MYLPEAYTYACRCISTHIRTHTYTHRHRQTHRHTHTHTHTYMQIYKYLSICTPLKGERSCHASICHICVYTYIHSHRSVCIYTSQRRAIMPRVTYGAPSHPRFSISSSCFVFFQVIWVQRRYQMVRRRTRFSTSCSCDDLGFTHIHPYFTYIHTRRHVYMGK
jgi:hypothetical protein